MAQVCWIQSWVGLFIMFIGTLVSSMAHNLNTEQCWYMTAQAQVHSSWKSGVENG